MKRHYTVIADGLYSIYVLRMGIRSGSARLICYMMAQIAELLHEGTDHEKGSARLYFDSNTFLKHCEVLAVNDDTAKIILTRDPNKRVSKI